MPLGDLLAATESVGDDEPVVGGAADGGKKFEFSDSCGDFVFVVLEAERSSHAAASGGGAALLRARAADRTAAGRVRPLPGKRPTDDRFNVWIRTTAPLPDDPAIHRCVLAYASDMTLLDTALMPHRRSVFDREHHGREPRPRAVVSPAVPRRPMAALHPGQPEHARRPRLRAAA